MTDRFSPSAQNILSLALALARELGHTYIGSEHILLAFSNDKGSTAEKLLSEVGVSSQRIQELITAKKGKGVREASTVSDTTPILRHIIEVSSQLATRDGNDEISSEHLFLALLKEDRSSAVNLLSECSVSSYDIARTLEKKLAPDNTDTAKKKSKRSDERLPTLQRFAQNMTLDIEAKNFDPVIGRERETERLMQTLIRRNKNNPCLIGEPGVGKSAIVEGLAFRIAEGNVPEELACCKIYSLDIPSMLAGAKYRGDFEERMKLVIDEVSKNPSVILFIDEFHTLIGAGSAEGAIDAANIIKPALARGKIKLIGATTLYEYRRHIEKDPAFERRFQPIRIEEPSSEGALAILRGLRGKYEKHHGVVISDSALREAVKLSEIYISDRFLPDKAIDLIDESAARIRIESHSMKRSRELLKIAVSQSAPLSEPLVLNENTDTRDVTLPRVEIKDIVHTVSSWTGIPTENIESENPEALKKMKEDIHSRVIGQDDAIEKICSAVMRSRAGIHSRTRPMGSFIFTGPTGVGKTELAKALARTLYGSERALTRFDMSEYSEPHSISKLIGSPPGYVGFDEGGQLSEKVRRNPHHVILFDEIEKAHRDIFDLLLQIMDEGCVCDSCGKKVSFVSSTVIMTSNVGADIAISGSRPMGFVESGEALGEKVYEKLRETFSSEFLSRPDEIILFRPLDYSALLKISKKMLDELHERLISEKEISVIFSDSVAEHVAKSCEKHSGARGIRHAVARKIEDPLSAFLLFSDVQKNGGIKAWEHVSVTYENGSISFRKEIGG